MSRRFTSAALCLLTVFLIAGNCTPGGPKNRLYLDPPLANVPLLTWVEVDVMADVQNGSLQAFEFGIQGTLGTVFLSSATPGEFDDDGALFLPPQLDVATNTLSRVVDLRHGPTAVTGTVRLATIQVFALAEGTAILSFVKTEFADPGGALLTATTVEGATLTVTP